MNLLATLFGSPVNSISPAEAHQRLSQKPRPFLLDVRQPEEFRADRIAGAKLIPLGELRSRLNELPKNQEIICVCHSGSRSVNATRILSGAGFRVANLQGGMIAWSRSGLPVSRGK